MTAGDAYTCIIVLVPIALVALRLVSKFNAIGVLQRLGAVESGLLGVLQPNPESLLHALNDFSDIGEDKRGAWLAATELAETAEGEE